MNALYLTQIAVILCCLSTILLCFVVARIARTLLNIQRAELHQIGKQIDATRTNDVSRVRIESITSNKW